MSPGERPEAQDLLYACKANKAQDTSGSATGSGSTPSTKKAQRVVEFAANASAPSSSSSPSPSTPLQLDSDFNWLADTGATSHMTPHRHWFKSYAPHKIPICLANNSVVYSAGIGSVVFFFFFFFFESMAPFGGPLFKSYIHTTRKG
jgi:hypothetical protein